MTLYAEIQKIFPRMAEYLNPSGLEAFRETPFGELAWYHVSLGLWLRNYVLVPGNPLYEEFRREKVYKKDEMSVLLIRLYHFQLNFPPELEF